MTFDLTRPPGPIATEAVGFLDEDRLDPGYRRRVTNALPDVGGLHPVRPDVTNVETESPRHLRAVLAIDCLLDLHRASAARRPPTLAHLFDTPSGPLLVAPHYHDHRFLLAE